MDSPYRANKKIIGGLQSGCAYGKFFIKTIICYIQNCPIGATAL